MSRPQLSFACELDPARLVELFADGSVIEDLSAVGARVMMMVSDFTERWCASFPGGRSDAAGA